MRATDVYNFNEMKPAEFNQPAVIIGKIIKDLENLRKKLNEKQKPNFSNLFENTSLDKRVLNILQSLFNKWASSEKKSVENKQEKVNCYGISDDQLIKEFLQILKDRELCVYLEMMNQDSQVILIISQFFSCFPEYLKELDLKIRDLFKPDFSWIKNILSKNAPIKFECKLELEQSPKTKLDDSIVTLSKKSITDLINTMVSEFDKKKEYNDECEKIEEAIGVKSNSLTEDDKEQLIERLSLMSQEGRCLYNCTDFTRLINNLIQQKLLEFSSNHVKQLDKLCGKKFSPNLEIAILECSHEAWNDVVQKIIGGWIGWVSDSGSLFRKYETYAAVIARANSSQLTELLTAFQKRDFSCSDVFNLHRIYAVMIPRLKFSEVQSLFNKEFFQQLAQNIQSLDPIYDEYWGCRPFTMEFIVAAILRKPETLVEKTWQKDMQANAIPLLLAYWKFSLTTKYTSLNDLATILNKFLLSLPADKRISFFRNLLEGRDELRSRVNGTEYLFNSLFQGLEFRADQFDLLHTPEEYRANNVFALFPSPVQRMIVGYITDETAVDLSPSMQN